MSVSELKDRQEEIEKLVLGVQEGDHHAFEQLYDIFIDPIFRYVFYRVKDVDAEDLVENVFLKVWENIRKYKRQNKKSFSAWIFRIAHNLVVDYYRSRKSVDFDELSFNLPDEKREHNPIKVVESSLHQDSLKIAMAKLKKVYQDVVIYKFINELSNSEIAEIMGKSEGSIRILQFRALKALKEELKALRGENVTKHQKSRL